MARPRSFVEDDVITAARDQFWSAGYAGTSLDDLTAATGLGRGSLYGAFGDKHDLFMRALERYCAEIDTDVGAQLQGPDGSAYQRLVRHIRTIAEQNATDSARRGCLISKSAAELGASDKDVTRTVKRAMRRYQAKLADTIASAQRDGDLGNSAHPADLAALLLALLRGMESLRKSGSSPATIRAIGEQAIALLPVA